MKIKDTNRNKSMVMSNKIFRFYSNSKVILNSYLIICIGLLFISNTLKAQQEPMYSQYMLNMVQINPAYAGNRAVDNFTTLYRMQWAGIDGAPTTASLSWDRRQDGTNVGYGLQVYNDKLGIESTSGIQAFYSYRLAFEKSCLTFGLSAGVLNYISSYSMATTYQSGDDLFQQDVNGWLPTVGIGALYATNDWYVGLSVPALLKTKIIDNNYQTTSSADNHYFLTGGYIYNVNTDLTLKPSLMIKAVKGAPVEVDYNINLWFQEKMAIGLSYRSGDALISMFEIQVTPGIHLGYAYDYTISNLKTYSNGSHELMMRFELNGSKLVKTLSPRYY